MAANMQEVAQGNDWGAFLRGIVQDQLKFRSELKLAEFGRRDATQISYGTEGQRAGQPDTQAPIAVPPSALSPTVMLIGGAIVLIVVMMAQRR